MLIGARLMLLSTLVAITACPRDKGDSVDGKSSKPPVVAAQPGSLAAVQARGRLRVLTPAVSKGYLPRSGTPLSFERDMAAKLAAELGVELELVHPPTFDLLLPWLQEDRGDLVAASLTVTTTRQQQADFTVPLGHVHEVLVGPRGSAPVKSKADLAGKRVVVRPSSAYRETLEKLRTEVPGLEIAAADEALDTQTLIEKVAGGELPFTAADSNLAEAVAQYDDQIAILFQLSDARPIAWAVRKGAADLLERTNTFVNRELLTPHKEETYTVDLDGIRQRKVLRMLTRNNSVNYWLHRGEEVGFEFELARAFAERLGVRLEIVLPPTRQELIPWLLEGKGDLIAASLTVTDARARQVAFGAPNGQIREVVVTRKGGPAIARPGDLAGRKVHIRLSTAFRQTLEALSASLPKPIEIVALDEGLEFEDELRKLLAGEIEIMITDSNVAESEVRYFPDLVIGPALTEERRVAWALRPDAPKLKAAVDAFFSKGDYKPRGLHYNILHARYFDAGERSEAAHQTDRSDKVGVISPYDALIRKYASQYQLDWRLLAAQMYQESRFDPQAKSWVGALGLMQVMPATAAGLGVGDVRQPGPGIHAGVKYMRQLVDQFDKTLPFRQRLRFALASYNAGKGHVDDARRRQRAGQLRVADPDPLRGLQWAGQGVGSATDSWSAPRAQADGVVALPQLLTDRGGGGG